MGKGGKSKGYISQGKHPTISRWLKNAMRRDRRAVHNNDSHFQSMRDRASARGAVKDKHIEEERVENAANDLFSRYGHVVDWAACVQAVKTDYVPSFHNKYGPRLSAK